jgi:hypothetical protein
VKQDPTFWILARAAGLTAYILLWAVVVAGLTLKARPPRPRVAPAAVLDVHRTITLLALGALALHGAALSLDRVVHLSPASLLVPGVAPYRPLWTSLGVLSAELMAVLAVSFRLRRRIGFRAWRRLHWASYACFAGATLHGLGAGSDSGRPLVRWMYVAAVASVTAAATWRTTAAVRA